MFNASEFTGDWQCPGREELNRDPRKRFPAQQNQEAYVYGKRLKGEAYAGLSEYCIEEPEALSDFDFDLVSAPEIRDVIRELRERTRTEKDAETDPILEIEAPFSVLAGIMDPMKLYACREEKAEQLKRILYKIADAQSIYIDTCMKAGCRQFSLADPVGSLNLVGEAYFREIVGSSELYLMKKCASTFEMVTVILCPLMARSLKMTGMEKEIPFIYQDECIHAGNGIETERTT